jgi:hypothetical protein
MRRLLVVIVFLISTAAFAQTTGGVVGEVTDASGGALPGVTVEARAATLQGTRMTVTDERGSYRLALLPPGEYTLSFSLPGFAPETKTLRVTLGGDASVDVSMRVAAATTIVVFASEPVVNTNTPSLATNFSQQAIETLPTGRNYASIVQVVPGVASDANPSNASQSTISVYGSSGAENAFYIDGVNTTNLEYGFQGTELNFEFIAEVNVKTGGYEAEYGRATGGIINVITKSGGNELTGDVFGYYDSDSLRADAKEVESTAGTAEGLTRKDYGFDIGGFLLRDKLWFFGAYDRVDHSLDSVLPGGPDAGDIVTSESKRSLASAKLTYKLGDAQSLVATYFQDPRDDTGAINDANHSLNGESSTYLGKQEFGGKDYALRYDGSFQSRFIFSAQVARHQESNSVGPATAAGEGVQIREASNDFFQRGGFGLIQAKEFERTHYAGSATGIVRGHEIKGGLEYQLDEAQVSKQMSGGQQVDIFANEANAARPIYRHFYWTTPDATLANAPVSALSASPEHRVTTVYLQDRWTLNDYLVISAGVRWDRQEIIDAAGVTQIDLSDDYAPRLGFTWDPSGSNRSKLFGSFGRFYEEIPMDLVIRSYSYERQPRIINYSATSTTPDPNAERDFGTQSAILGGLVTPADPDLGNQYINEYIVGYEREVRPNLAFGVKGIYRNYGEVIEDFLCADDGTYCIGNPGKGLMDRVFTLDYSQTFPAPRAKRTFKGLQLDANKRFSDNWQAMASYIFSKLEGNFDGEYAPFTNIGADPNITAAYDYYDFFTDGRNLDRITNTGPLSNDRRHQLKMSGIYETPYKLSLGVSAYWRSGTPVTRYGFSDAYGRYEFFLTERGGEGRTPATYDADLHLGYPIKAGPTTVRLLLDVFNVLNAQRAILLDQRWGFQESDNAAATPANPRYMEPVLRTPPIAARLGVRVSF